MRIVIIAAIVALSFAITAGATAQPATTAATRDLLRATAPGAFSVRYLPDRAIISASASETLSLSIHLPKPPLWAYLDGRPTAVSAVGWDEAGNRVGGVVAGPAPHTTRHAGPHRAVHATASASYRSSKLW